MDVGKAVAEVKAGKIDFKVDKLVSFMQEFRVSSMLTSLLTTLTK
jgi:hypothetical protein